MTQIFHKFVNPISDQVGLLGTKPSDWNAVHTDASGHPITIETGPTPQMFGAFGDGTSHKITAADVAANSQWIGTYVAGMEWDYVATQECIYACFASTSTPGNVIWNITVLQSSFIVNSRMFIPPGDYQISGMLVLCAIGFYIEWADRGDATWSWTGTVVTTGNTHSSTTIDNIPPADLAIIAVIPGTNIPVNTGSVRGPCFVIGPGILPGTSVVTINKTTGSITLSQATTATAAGVGIMFTMSMFYCNSVTYGAFVNPSMQANVQLPRAGFFDDITILEPCLEYSPCFCALWTLNQSVAPPGSFGVAQISIYDASIQSGSLADVGVSIAPSRGIAEGATIQFFNSQMSDFWVAAVQQSGANALNNSFFGADFIGNPLFSIQNISGTIETVDATFEAQSASNLFFSPQVGQISNRGGDTYFGSGTGLGSPSEILGTRSEGSVLAIIIGESVSIRNCSVLAADQFNWILNFPFQIGAVIFPTANNTKSRSFICVDSGGTNTYKTMTSNSIPSDTITDPSAAYVVNQWVGYSLFFRFGTAGFTDHFTGEITANTATAVTITGESFTPNVASLYSIGGQTAAIAPNFDSATASHSDGLTFGGGRGFTLTPGSNQVTTPNNVPVGQYIVVPLGDVVGPDPLVTKNLHIIGPVVCPYIAKVTGSSGGGPFVLTMSKPAGRYVTGGPGYWGPALADGTQGLMWLEIDYDAAYKAELIDGFHINGGGRLSGCDMVRNVHAVRTADWYNGTVDSGLLNTPRGTVEAGQYGMRLTTDLDATQATLDLTTTIETGNYSKLTPTQDMTLNAPTPLSSASQEWTLIVLTSGASSWNITFGTNMLSTGVLATGVTTAKRWLVKFVSDGTDWIELSRAGPL